MLVCKICPFSVSFISCLQPKQAQAHPAPQPQPQPQPQPRAPFAVPPAPPPPPRASSNRGDSEVYGAVLRHVEEMFDAIRLRLLEYGVTNYVRAKLLQPVTSLAMKQVPSSCVAQHDVC